jgi:hypothetical protein
MVDEAGVAYGKVMAGAGCSLHRDAVDLRLIAELTSLGKRGKIIHDEAEVGGISPLKGGPPPVSTAGDGVPDAWKIARGLDPKDPGVAQSDLNHDGYTNLERYLNEVAGDPPR